MLFVQTESLVGAGKIIVFEKKVSTPASLLLPLRTMTIDSGFENNFKFPRAYLKFSFFAGFSLVEAKE